MKKTKQIVAIAMLISVLNISQSHAYFGEMSLDTFRANAAAGQATRKYYLDGEKIKYECILDKNKDGVCKKFYKNGHAARETKCTNKGKHTAYKSFFENGQLASESHYRNGQKDGQFKQYYWRSASALSYRQPSSESSYKNGYLHGMSKQYSPDGTVTSSQNYN